MSNFSFSIALKPKVRFFSFSMKAWRFNVRVMMDLRSERWADGRRDDGRETDTGGEMERRETDRHRRSNERTHRQYSTHWASRLVFLPYQERFMPYTALVHWFFRIVGQSGDTEAAVVVAVVVVAVVVFLFSTFRQKTDLLQWNIVAPKLKL